MIILRRSWLEAGAAACGGGALLGLAFSGDAAGSLAWIALVPWLLVVRRLAPLPAFGFGWVGGLVAALVTFGWLANVPAFGAAQFAVLGGYVALYAACWCAGLAMLARRQCSWLVYAPALWVALDVVRDHAGFLALPIASLAQSQHANIALLQLASLGGEAAVTWIVVLGNVAVAALVQRRVWRGPLLALGAVAAAHAAGAVMLGAAASDDQTVAPIRIAAVQPNIGLHERDTAAGRDAIWQRLERLSLEAAAARPDLIVWPETAVGDPRHDPRLAEAAARAVAGGRCTVARRRIRNREVRGHRAGRPGRARARCLQRRLPGARRHADRRALSQAAPDAVRRVHAAGRAASRGRPGWYRRLPRAAPVTPMPASKCPGRRPRRRRCASAS